MSIVSPRGPQGGGTVTHNWTINAQGAVEGVAVQIRHELEYFVSGFERHLHALPAAYGANQ